MKPKDDLDKRMDRGRKPVAAHPQNKSESLNRRMDKGRGNKPTY